MKLFIAVFALAAVAFAEPEADPEAFYSAIGFAGAYSPLAYRSAYLGAALPYAAGTPWAGLPYSYSPFTYGLASPALVNPGLGYTAKVGARTIAANPGAVHITKRDADADADAFYANVYGSPLAYSTGLYAPSVYRSAYAYGALPYTAAATYGAPWGYTGLGYTGLGYPGARYIAHSGGATHIVKREADAEADPEAFYNTLGYTYASSPLSYAAYTSPVVSSPVVSTLGYSTIGAAPLAATTYAASPLSYRYNTPYAYSPFYNGLFGARYFK